ncbi:MAG: DUF2283 domain-containing protein [Roseiflexaceae bacterium]|nr:DUF2283 domain-containing protein [Roseiflexaceae bacterium]
MSIPNYKYDEISDTLTITFVPGALATGIELNDHILLRVDKVAQRAVGMSIFDYSVLAQPTEFGLRSLPLSGLDELSESTRDLVLAILQSEPVHSVLALSAYAPTATETIAIAALQLPNPLLQAA